MNAESYAATTEEWLEQSHREHQEMQRPRLVTMLGGPIDGRQLSTVGDIPKLEVSDQGHVHTHIVYKLPGDHLVAYPEEWRHNGKDVHEQIIEALVIGYVSSRR